MSFNAIAENYTDRRRAVDDRKNRRMAYMHRLPRSECHHPVRSFCGFRSQMRELSRILCAACSAISQIIRDAVRAPGKLQRPATGCPGGLSGLGQAGLALAERARLAGAHLPHEL